MSSSSQAASTLAANARAIFTQALAAVDIPSAIQRHISIDANTLTLHTLTIPRSNLDDLILIAIGKAAVPMYQAAAESLGNTLPHRAIIVTPTPQPNTPSATYLQGPHPTPTQASLQAANAVLNLLQQATPRTAVLFLISGGASAMFDAPLSPTITPGDLIAFHRALVASGLPIAQMNTLRKHVSAVKGGRLALAAATAAMQCTLLISDVPGNDPSIIGSGPSLPDTSSLADCREILSTLPTSANLPQNIVDFLHHPSTPETPKPTNPAFSRSTSAVILSNDHLANAAARAASDLGFHTEINNACDDLDYREAVTYLLARSAALARQHPRTCLISVGELSVPLSSNPGEGGRNQHFALYAATQLAAHNQQATLLSAGSDGIDGHSPFAGAIADPTTPARATALGLDPAETLANFNTSPLFRALGDAIQTGPTGNNLRDLRLILTDSV